MKKNLTLCAVFGILLSFIQPAQARNETYMLLIEEAMKTQTITPKPDGSIKFYFGKENTPALVERIHTDIITKKIRIPEKDDVLACNQALLSALEELQQRAKKMGGNAIINIVSYYKDNEMSSSSRFECHAGSFSAVYTLKADIAKVGNN